MKISAELENGLIELEDMQGKAKTICEDLKERYFSMDYENFKLLNPYQDNAKTKNEIVFDYLCQIERKLRELRILTENT